MRKPDRHFRACVRAATVIAAAATGFAATAGGAGLPALAMLDRLEPGLWQISGRDEADTVRMCIAEGRALIQIRHRREACRRVVVEDLPGQVTVHYTCPGNGYGHTQIRFEDPRLVQLETQGLDGGLPFNFVAEARRIGPCR